MLDLSIKKMFFDRRRVMNAVDRARRRVLSKAGAFIMQRAKTSIKPRVDPAPPGRPPSSHTGLLRNFIFFGYDERSDSVVIGPVPMKRQRRSIPQLLETGGTVKSTRPHYIRVRKGRGGKGRSRKTRTIKVPAGTTLKYRPRPYMVPALKAEEPGLPKLWANSVKGI